MQVMQFAIDVEGSRLLSRLKAYCKTSNQNVVQSIIEAFKKKGEPYAKEKERSLKNIFGRAYMTSFKNAYKYELDGMPDSGLKFF